jgi:putative NADH-flavin reductase
MMKIALTDASGSGGSLVVNEISHRARQITAIVLNPDEATELSTRSARHDDVPEGNGSVDPSGHDLVVSAEPIISHDPTTLNSFVKNAGIERYLIVGRAGRSETARHPTRLSYFV